MTQAAGQGIGRDKVVELISSVIKKVEEKGDVSREAIQTELRELSALIEQTRAEIRQTGMSEIGGKHIPSATDELDAVVAATEVATEAIMDGCDAIAAQAAKLPPADGEALTVEVTKILEACSFQDITGQRITKVVKSLKTIDEKVARLLSILDDKVPGLHQADEGDTRTGDAKLLNGPQMPDKAISQDDIDKLLADLF
jgi:chemotaxis protein CheZ